jgi:hypothetical protein
MVIKTGQMLRKNYGMCNWGKGIIGDDIEVYSLAKMGMEPTTIISRLGGLIPVKKWCGGGGITLH